MHKLVVALTLAALPMLAGCGAKGPNYQTVVNRWGSYHIDENVQLRVSAVGMTQMRYEVWHAPTNKVLISDYGRDSRGWVFVWDERDRLWAHWDELGTVVWVPQDHGRFEKHWLTRDSAMIGEVPSEFSSQLPTWARRNLELY